MKGMKGKEARAIVGLAEAGDDPEVTLNKLLTTHKDRRIRKYAAWALGARDEVANTKPLIKALEDKSEMVRKEAILACGRLKIRRAVPILREMLAEDPGYGSTLVLLRAFTLFQDKRATPYIWRCISNWEVTCYYDYLLRTAVKALIWIELGQHGIQAPKWLY